MVQNPVLFDLIKKLTGPEKRYFSVFAPKQAGTKSYLTLFQELDRMETCDEVLLKTRLKDRGGKIAQLSVAKNDLRQLILKALRAFREPNSFEQGIQAMIAEADILNEKGLYVQSLKRLEKAKKIANRYEKHGYVLEIISRLIQMNALDFIKKADRKFADLFAEYELVLKKANREAQYRMLQTGVSQILSTRNAARTLAFMEKIEEIEQNDLLRSISESDSFQSKLSFLDTLGSLKHLRKDFESANPYYKKIIELWDEYPHIRDVNTRLYKGYLTNYLNSCHTLGNYEAFDELLAKFQSIPDSTFDEEAGSFKDYYHITLLYLMNTGQFEKALEIMPALEKGLVCYRERITKAREITLRFNAFIVFFFCEKFEKALDWLNTLGMDDKIKPRADTRSLARIFRIIIYYELGHTSALNSLRISVHRKLKKQEHLHDFERIVLNHVRLLEQNMPRKLSKPLWEKLVGDLTALGEKYGWNQVYGLDEIHCWAESRLKNRPIRQIFRERLKKGVDSR
ncbi:MAG: hypothetical protein HY842_14425 [Bacteroidetes bacterium]|nr:hypothetical protein [Bacteroidota bacterium]